jgi:hypothetical protein
MMHLGQDVILYFVGATGAEEIRAEGIQKAKS